MKSFAAALLLASSAEATSLRAQVEANLRVGGPVNCGYKCGLMWNQRQDWNPNNGFQLYEYAACLEGCELCNGGDDFGCMSKCKATNWATYTYTFNNARALKQVENAAIAKPLTDCLDSCISTQFPVPGEGAGKDGNLPNAFTSCTQGCYNNNFDNVRVASLAECEKDAVDFADATATCDDLSTTCYTKNQCFFGLAKGVVEPDKACIQGCSQNLCQDGAMCLGKGYWLDNGSPLTTGCQLITPQTQGIRETINPGYYGQQSDLGDCCNAVLQRCGYAPGVGPASFGVTLGKVIATDTTGCLKPEGGIYGDVIYSMPNYNCRCDNFFAACPGAMENFPDTFTCYQDGQNPKTRTQASDGTVTIN